MRLLGLGLLFALDLIGARASWPAQRIENSITVKPTTATNVTLPQVTLPESLPFTVNDSTFSIQAAGALAIDSTTDQVLLEKNSHVGRPIASITKLATILVILHNHNLDETVTVPTLPGYGPADAKLGLASGEQFKLRDLLAATLIPSANDAADTLAIYDAGSVSAFAAKMNATASEWGIGECHFSNASGLVDTDNFASPRALAKIAELALTNPTVVELVASSTGSISNLSGKQYTLTTTNHLLQDKRFSGIKTGYTIAAGQSLVTRATISGHSIITVVLASPDRFGETQAMVNFLEKNTSWQNFKP